MSFDGIEEVNKRPLEAMRRLDEELMSAISLTVPELMGRSYLDPLPALRPRPTIEDYEHDLALLGHPGHDAFGHLRDLVLIGIRVGTIGVEDVYHRVRPATIALTVLLDPGAGPIAPELVRRIRRRAGRGTGRWIEAIAAVDAWPGSLHSLLRQTPQTPQEPQEPQKAGEVPVRTLLGLNDHLWRGANILLALAPPQTLSRLASRAAPMAVTGPVVGDPEAVRNARTLMRLAGHAPLSRPIVDYALDPRASARVRMALAGNPLTPNAVLTKLLAFADDEPGVAAAVCLHECAPPAVRLAAYRKVRDPGILDKARPMLQRDAELVRRVQQIASLADGEASLAHAMIRDGEPELPLEARLFAYAHLARISGMEVAWALEMERAGTLEKMHPAVRASMESGSPVPLFEAALADPYRGVDQDSVTSVRMLRSEEMLDRPFPLQSADFAVPAGGAELPT